jgi:hypothetical protein
LTLASTGSASACARAGATNIAPNRAAAAIKRDGPPKEQSGNVDIGTPDRKVALLMTEAAMTDKAAPLGADKGRSRRLIGRQGPGICVAKSSFVAWPQRFNHTSIAAVRIQTTAMGSAASLPLRLDSFASADTKEVRSLVRRTTACYRCRRTVGNRAQALTMASHPAKVIIPGRSADHGYRWAIDIRVHPQCILLV